MELGAGDLVKVGTGLVPDGVGIPRGVGREPTTGVLEIGVTMDVKIGMGVSRTADGVVVMERALDVAFGVAAGTAHAASMSAIAITWPRNTTWYLILTSNPD
jgi:hypothetical protein